MNNWQRILKMLWDTDLVNSTLYTPKKRERFVWWEYSNKISWRLPQAIEAQMPTSWITPSHTKTVLVIFYSRITAKTEKIMFHIIIQYECVDDPVTFDTRLMFLLFKWITHVSKVTGSSTHCLQETHRDATLQTVFSMNNSEIGLCIWTSSWNMKSDIIITKFSLVRCFNCCS
jgi:hypothetical protein